MVGMYSSKGSRRENEVTIETRCGYRFEKRVREHKSSTEIESCAESEKETKNIKSR